MKRLVEVPKLLHALGIDARNEHGKWIASCPNPDHPREPGKKSTPSWSMIDDASESTGSHFCFGCRFRGGPWELVAAMKGLTIEDAGRWVSKEMLGQRQLELEDVPVVRIRARSAAPLEMRLPSGVVIPSVHGGVWHPEAWDYLTGPIAQKKRGVADWQAQRWHLGYATRGRCAYRVVIPVYTYGRLLAYVARAFLDDGSRRYDVAKRSDPGARPDVALFGEAGFDPAVDVATVTEGCFGMFAFERAEAPNPCAILGAANLGPEKIRILAGFRMLLVATDPDAAGDLAFEAIYNSCCRWTDVRRVPLFNKPDEASREELQQGWQRAMLRRRVWGTGALTSPG